MEKNERLSYFPDITFKTRTKQDYEMVQLLSDLSGNTLSSVVGLALHEWLKDNFVDEVKRYQEVEHLLNETGIPNHLHDLGEDK